MFRLRNLLLLSTAILFAAGDPPAPTAGEPTADGGVPPAEGTAGDAPAADGTPPAESAEGDGEPAAGEGDPPAAAEPKPDWRDRELSRKHAKVQAKERENQELRQRLADAEALLDRGGTPPAAGETPPARAAAPASNEEAIKRGVQVELAKQNYDDQCNTTFAKGAAEYKDKWTPALDRIQTLGGFGDGAEGVEVMTGILATDDPAKVLFELGNNPDTFHRVMALPPHRRMTEMVKLALPAPKTPAKKPSAAGAPVEPLSRRADARDDQFLYRDNVPDEQWYARRKADKARKWAEKNGQRVA